MLQSIQNKLLFPAPDTSYAESGPLRLYTLNGQFSFVQLGEVSYRDFRSQLVWADQTPCIVFPHTSSSKILIYAHANGEDIWRASTMLAHLRDELGMHCLAFEYPSYGIAPGKPSESSILGALESVDRFLRGDFGFLRQDMVLYGRSLGAAVVNIFASRLPADESVAAVLLMSGFTGIRDVARFSGGHNIIGSLASMVAYDGFQSMLAIPSLTSPLLVMHGEADEIVPCSHGRALFAQATCEKRMRVVAAMGHNSVMTRAPYRELVVAEFRQFLRSADSPGYLGNKGSSTPIQFFPELWLQADVSCNRAHPNEGDTALAVLSRLETEDRVELMNNLWQLHCDISRHLQAGYSSSDLKDQFIHGLIAKIRSLFDALDLDLNQRLRRTELVLLLDVVRTNEAQLEASTPSAEDFVLEGFGCDDSGDIGFDEFVVMCCGRSALNCVLRGADKAVKKLLTKQVEGRVQAKPLGKGKQSQRSSARANGPRLGTIDIEVGFCDEAPAAGEASSSRFRSGRIRFKTHI